MCNFHRKIDKSKKAQVRTKQDLANKNSNAIYESMILQNPNLKKLAQEFDLQLIKI